MKRVGAIVRLGLLLATFAAAGLSQFSINVDVDLVNVSFSATDNKGRLIGGLTAADFTIKEDGRKQDIVLFARERESPLTLAMLIDISRSVEEVFEEEKRTAATFLQSALGPRDIALVIAFDKEVTLVQDYSENVPLLERAIDRLELSNNGTSLFDAVYLAADDKLAREAGRKAIVVISDGIDTTSIYGLGRALIAAHRSDTVIYSISNGGKSDTLQELSEETGGSFFRIRKGSDFEEIFRQISSELRTQYSVAYHPSNNAKDGKFRRIEVVPKDSKLRIRARKGYYAPSQAPTR